MVPGWSNALGFRTRRYASALFRGVQFVICSPSLTCQARLVPCRSPLLLWSLGRQKSRHMTQSRILLPPLHTRLRAGEMAVDLGGESVAFFLDDYFLPGGAENGGELSLNLDLPAKKLDRKIEVFGMFSEMPDVHRSWVRPLHFDSMPISRVTSSLHIVARAMGRIVGGPRTGSLWGRAVAAPTAP